VAEDGRADRPAAKPTNWVVNDASTPTNGELLGKNSFGKISAQPFH